MTRSLRVRSRRFRWLLPVVALGAAAVLGGCVAYPDDYYGYSNYGYGYGYAPAPYYGYNPGYVAFGFGGDHDWGDHDWGDHDWHGGWHHGHDGR
ncbi:MAG TPA: hypothetical protein VFN42_08585 [Acetobacteraceae bacterium]|nr:hypothetical protein [Acetobacteraceae bacterium]